MRFVRNKQRQAEPNANPLTDGQSRVEVDAEALRALSTTFTPPRWLKDLGRTAWLLVGVFALVAGVIWLLGATYTITGPVVGALIVATVVMPVVTGLARHMPRAAACRR